MDICNHGCRFVLFMFCIIYLLAFEILLKEECVPLFYINYYVPHPVLLQLAESVLSIRTIKHVLLIAFVFCFTFYFQADLMRPFSGQTVFIHGNIHVVG